MKLQFAFGNPRKRKRHKSKPLAKRRKTKKTKRVKKSRKKSSNKAVVRKLREAIKMAKKRKPKKVFKKRRHGKRRKNPEAAIIRKGGKIIGREFSPLSKRETDALHGKIQSLKKQLNQAKSEYGAGSPQWSKLYKELVKAGKGMDKKLGKRGAYLKTLERYAEEGASISKFDLAKKGEGKMAKRRKKRKSSAKKHKKAAKSAKRSHKRRKSRRKHSAKKRRSRKHSAKKAHSKKRHSKKGHAKRRKSRRRRRARMITHRHSANTRHIKKGTSFRFKAKSKRGKRSITVSGRVKVNPHRRNPMKQLSAQSKKYLGLDAAELTSLAVGGALVPIVNAGIGKIPGMSTVVAKINEFVGPQAVGSVVPLLTGVALNAVAEHAYKGKGSEYIKMAGEGLAAAGVIGLIMSMSQKYITPALGLSGMGIMPMLNGVNYTPSMRGVNYTPSMRGVNYTPEMRGMGIMPQLNGMGEGPDFGSADYGGGGGYTQAHKFSRADFGANFSEDSEAEGLEDQDNSYSSSMN